MSVSILYIDSGEEFLEILWYLANSVTWNYHQTFTIKILGIEAGINTNKNIPYVLENILFNKFMRERHQTYAKCIEDTLLHPYVPSVQNSLHLSTSDQRALEGHLSYRRFLFWILLLRYHSFALSVFALFSNDLFLNWQLCKG